MLSEFKPILQTHTHNLDSSLTATRCCAMSELPFICFKTGNIHFQEFRVQDEYPDVTEDSLESFLAFIGKLSDRITEKKKP